MKHKKTKYRCPVCNCRYVDDYEDALGFEYFLHPENGCKYSGSYVNISAHYDRLKEDSNV